ncbi:hypothetical protein DERP_012032 [Dermatophagoides pteronyssinus]|uniref:Transmembrane protein n=1 Tax=Dermatophagoides pteronyssinus TaxID=6956 RepID=A0ABQ8IVM9_DERPT|nr:hypothetical protein DERP_012032 [Dermatophagoides pteronyssinus]
MSHKKRTTNQPTISSHSLLFNSQKRSSVTRFISSQRSSKYYLKNPMLILVINDQLMVDFQYHQMILITYNPKQYHKMILMVYFLVQFPFQLLKDYLHFEQNLKICIRKWLPSMNDPLLYIQIKLFTDIKTAKNWGITDKN